MKATWRELRARGATPRQLLRMFDVEAPPIPVVELAAGMGVGVYWSDDLETDGALHMDLAQEVAEIFVRSGTTRERMRFTVAHEIGHLMLHEFDGVVHREPPRGRGRTNEEREANAYAADLLMPEWLVRFAGREFGFSASVLAGLFDVSDAAMRYRLESISLPKLR